MAYSIYKTNGTLLANIADGTLDTTSTSVSLPGRNFAGYGQPQDTNFVQMVENFANDTPPRNPLKGQLWYNTGNSTLFVCPSDGQTNPSAWSAISTTASNGLSSFGNIHASGNITVDGNVYASGFHGTSIDVLYANVSVKAIIADMDVANANVTTKLTTTSITTGSAITPGSMVGTWTITGGLAGTTLTVANGNIITSGIKASTYYNGAGDVIDLAGYTNTNVFNYLTGTGVLPFSGNLTPGNVTGVNLVSAAVLSGTLAADSSSQPNVTSVGSLISLNVTGTVRSGDAILGNLATSNYFAGVFAASASNQPNITSVGTLGNLVVTSNVAAGNVKTDNYLYANGTPVSFGGGGGGGSSIANGTSNVSVASSGNVTVGIGGVANVLKVTTTGANITGYANVSGNVTAGNVAASALTGNLITATQANITSVGTLTGLTMGGNIDLNVHSLANVRNITFSTVPTTGITSGSTTINWGVAQNYVQAAPTGILTYAFGDPPGPCHLQLFINQTATVRAINWPSTGKSVKWLGATYAGVSGKAAVVNFWYDGSYYWAMTANEV